MKKLLPVLFLFITLSACEESSVPTGSDDVIEYPSVVFVITSKTVVDNKFFVEGTVRNTGDETFTPTWYMEAQFYTDTNQSLKLGGSADSFNFSLNKNETTKWELEYSNRDQNLDNYPDFGVGNLRAFKR